MLGAGRACGAERREGPGGGSEAGNQGSRSGRGSRGETLTPSRALPLRGLQEVWTVWTLSPRDGDLGVGAAPGFPSPPNWSPVSPAGSSGPRGRGSRGQWVQGAAGPGGSGPGDSGSRGQQDQGQQARGQQCHDDQLSERPGRASEALRGGDTLSGGEQGGIN